MTSEPKQFPPGVVEKLDYYVYRLVDPRNGETFYVGKGRGDRVFQHAKLALVPDEDSVSLKFSRINKIKAAGLEVIQIIHRHGVKTEAAAYQIEAALIDAYPGLSNEAGGHGSDDFGVRHVRELIAVYQAEPFVPSEPLILISIGRSHLSETLSLYDAVRGTWVIDPKKAETRKLVLAHRRGLVVGAFRPDCWIPGTAANFPWLEASNKRWGFVGREAEAEVLERYLQKRVPDKYRLKGASSPIRYVEPEETT